MTNETPEPRLAILALGPTLLALDGRRFEGPWCQRRAGRLLKFLVARRGRAASVDEIAEALWPGASYGAAANVRYHVHVLRRVLEPAREGGCESSLIRCRDGGYGLDTARVGLDADEFERALAAGETACALELYRGEFLADEPYASWAHPERQRLHELACAALRQTVEERLAAGDGPAARAALSRLADMQPYDEDVHRELIAFELSRGRRSDALRRYTAFSHRLREAFGEEPAFGLAELR